LIRQQLAETLLHELKDPRVGYVTVTEVRLSKDLGHARVFVSIYGDREQRERSLAGLRAASGFLKSRLGHALKLRCLPTLDFCLDDTLDVAERIAGVSAAIAAGETEPPPDVALDLVAVDDGREPLVIPPPPTASRSKKGKSRTRAKRSRNKR